MAKPQTANVRSAIPGPGRLRQKSVVTNEAHPSASERTRISGSGRPRKTRESCGQRNM